MFEVVLYGHLGPFSEADQFRIVWFGIRTRTTATKTRRQTRMSCSPAKYAHESVEGCLARFRTWASRLPVLDGREVGFEALSQAAPDARPVRFEQIGWRTVLTMPQATPK
jgi:hypothetical protein